MTTPRRTTTTIRPQATADQYIRQQDTCTPWGLHYNAYQDTYRPTHPRPSTRRTPRKHATA
ncbi:hypothetical protein [Kribbella monticola]|uniref:hypothetical protein n=1 Tax=Kribbella monticola TaxID=2185285 RepID=UPI000DD3B320|nr:hypothetical protein [Kribbella monticola]